MIVCVLQVLAEALAHVARCLVVVVGVTTATDWGVLVFCAGQVSLSLALSENIIDLLSLHFHS